MSKIEWTEKTWNPVRGCKAISPGCANCYAATMTARLEAMGNPGYAGLTRLSHGRKLNVWTGEFREAPEMLDIPLKRRIPTTYFVNSMSDLFGEGVSNEYIAAVFGVMAATPRHTYQVLTKRAERLPTWFEWYQGKLAGFDSMLPRAREHLRGVTVGKSWPLPNVWLGVSVEDKKHGLPRIEHLRRTPASVRFLSIEPLLEDLGEIDLTGIHWVIVGGESGHGARPMHSDWARSIRDQCVGAKVPFFFKQWGAWAPHSSSPSGMYLTTKGNAGRLLDGRTWDEMPEVKK